SISTGVILQVSDDRDLTRREAALQIGFYATTRTYRPVLERRGFGDRVEPLRRAFASGDHAGMVEIALPMVDAFAIAGPVDECRDRLRAYEGIAASVLSAEQHQASVRFAERHEGKFDGIPHRMGAAGMPILEGSLAHVDCEVEAEYPGGDHVILVARVTEATSREGLPLVFFRG